MSFGLTEQRRLTLPRWRSSFGAALRGELDSIGNVDDTSQEIAGTSVEHALKEWTENPTLMLASEVIGLSLFEDKPERARSAAEFILARSNHAPSAVQSLASDLLNRLSESDRFTPVAPEDARQNVQRKIRTLRQQLRRLPDDAIARTDIAHAYGSLGMLDQAERSLRIALSLAPDDRLILRSLSRLHVHKEEYDKAIYVLRHSPRSRFDPWLMSAEISISELAGKTPRFSNLGRNLLARESVPPFHQSELASALGTLELAHGNKKGARRLFEKALRDPTENVVAQAEWVTRELKIDIFRADLLDVPLSFEARARDHFANLNWQDSLHEASCWTQDERVSSRGAVFGSHLASVALEDFRTAANFARFGLLANPDHWLLANNLAFSCASMNDTKHAKEALSGINSSELDGHAKAVLKATRGLVEFRTHNPQAGRVLYTESTEDFRALGESHNEAIATCYWAREEILLCSALYTSLLSDARKLAGESPPPALKILLERIERAAQKTK